MAPPRAQYSDLYAATYGKDAAGGAATLVTASLRDADDPDDTTGQSVEVWGVAPVIYVPAEPDDAGACQGLTATIGRTPVCFATRDLRAANALPGLGPGDAAFVCPTGRGGVLVKPDGTLSLIQRGQGDDPDASLTLEPDGALVYASKHGNLVFDADGFRVVDKAGNTFGVGGGDFTVKADRAMLAAGQLGIGPAPSVPLAVAPLTIAATGGGPGFYCPVPIKSIFVTP